MPAEVSMSEVLQEIRGLSGSFPTISVLTDLEGKLFFAASTRLRVNNSSLRGTRRYCEATDENSADLAILKVYTSLFEISTGSWLEAVDMTANWKFDPEIEGWEKLEG